MLWCHFLSSCLFIVLCFIPRTASFQFWWNMRLWTAVSQFRVLPLCFIGLVVTAGSSFSCLMIFLISASRSGLLRTSECDMVDNIPLHDFNFLPKPLLVEGLSEFTLASGTGNWMGCLVEIFCEDLEFYFYLWDRCFESCYGKSCL